ncbi:MAG: hypothetical protein IPM76_27795 [Chloroflexi bacterium]|nr:hypothetical protein [Chloroflexota bacterium]
MTRSTTIVPTAGVTSINAGVDMNMVPYDYNRFIATLAERLKMAARFSMERYLTRESCERHSQSEI